MVPASLDMQALRSAPPEGYAGLVAPAPTSGPTRPTPGVPFVSRRKEPKACHGRCPWTPLGGYYHPPSGGKRRSPPERGASSGGTQATNRLPRHGLTAESVPPVQLGEKIRPICPPTQSGKSVFFCATNPIEGVAACRRGSGSEKCFTFHSVPLSGSRGGSPWRAFGDFPRDGKVTRVPSMAKPCSRGAPAGGCRDYQSRKSPRGAGRSARSGGVGAKSDDLLLRGRSPLASSSRVCRAERPLMGVWGPCPHL